MCGPTKRDPRIRDGRRARPWRALLCNKVHRLNRLELPAAATRGECKIARQSNVDSGKPTFQSAIGSNANLIVGALLFGGLFVADTIYQLRRGYYLQAIGAAILVGLIGYVLIRTLYDAFKGPQKPAHCSIDGWGPPRSRAVMVLLAVCVTATVVGWMLPHHWYLDEGTVGRSGVWQHHEWWRLVTSPFLHANYLHVYYNMLALWFLGSMIDTTLGTPRFLAIYFGAALGGGLAVVAAGQERTLGVSGAVYGLMGAAFCFGFRAFRAGHRSAAKRMIVASGALIAVNLLFSFAVPNISIAAHVGGLLTGFFIAIFVGFPVRLNDAWALSDRCPSPASFTYDVNADRFSYHGPAGFALKAGLVAPSASASTKESGWSPHLNVSDLDPQTPIECFVEDPYVLFSREAPKVAASGADSEAAAITA